MSVPTPVIYLSLQVLIKGTQCRDSMSSPPITALFIFPVTEYHHSFFSFFFKPLQIWCKLFVLVESKESCLFQCWLCVFNILIRCISWKIKMNKNVWQRGFKENGAKKKGSSTEKERKRNTPLCCIKWKQMPLFSVKHHLNTKAAVRSAG